MKKLITYSFILSVTTVLGSLALLYFMIYQDTYSGPQMSFEVKQRETFSSINARLKSKGAINSARLFHRYCQYKGVLTKFRPGNYEIHPGQNMVDIIDMLIEGNEAKIIVTIPEGKNIFEIAEILAEKKLVDYDKFLQIAKSEEKAKSLGIPGPRLEGYLYPDTYYFTEQMDEEQIIKMMVSVFKEKTKNLDFSQQKLNKHQLIVLASIVEKETGAGFERPIIAGVFFNRLKKRMRLQSDPTTIYGIFENYNGNLRKKHLLEKTPYNTYKISGLPIGPIANPGLKAIQAVLNPQKHDYLYFVSLNNGEHVFSKTYKEHLLYVEKYQKSSKYRTGRSWRDLQKKTAQNN